MRCISVHAAPPGDRRPLVSSVRVTARVRVARADDRVAVAAGGGLPCSTRHARAEVDTAEGGAGN
jgi:hypothetical protein